MKGKIAVFASGWSNEFIEYILNGIKENAAVDGFDIFTFVIYPAFDRDKNNYNEYLYNIFNLCNPIDFDGAIVLANTFNILSNIEPLVNKFKNANVPIITLEAKLPGVSSIISNNYIGMKDLTNHLIKEHNVKNVVYVNGIGNNLENTERRQAVIDALSDNCLELSYEINCDFSYFVAFTKITNLLETETQLPDVFICANDNMALGTCAALYKKGYHVPKDVIVTGFDKTKDSQCNIPSITTVSRRWDAFGQIAYERLIYQMNHPNEIFDDKYSSKFVIGESCGCSASPDVQELRITKMQDIHFENAKKTMQDMFFRKLQLAISNVATKEAFESNTSSIMKTSNQTGNDFCLCTDPFFFEHDDYKYPDTIIDGYSPTMDALYCQKDGNSIPFHTFDSSCIYPGYEHKKGESNHYIISPINNMHYMIGYVAIKNNDSSLYDQSLGVLCMNFSTILLSMRRYIFSERNNRRLENIYMTDSLTGIYNRAGCKRILYDFINSQIQDKKSTVLAFADVDNMKTINDQYGHLNGDLALKAASDAFQQCTSSDWLFARYGGDEFIAVGNCADEESITNIFNKISCDMDKYIETLNLSFPLSLSVGYTVINPDNQKSIDDYIKLADDAMYKNKQRNKENC